MNDFTKEELVIIFNYVHHRKLQFKKNNEFTNKLEEIQNKLMQLISPQEYNLTKFGSLTSLKEL